MKLSNILRILFLPAVFFLTIPSCRKFVDIAPPIQNIIGDNAFADSTTATATVTGLYSRMMGTGTLQMTTGAVTVYTGLCADELSTTTTANSVELFYTNSIPTTSALLRDKFWLKPYNYIYHANACLEGLSQAGNLTLSLKNRLSGEMKFIRALCYFYLVNVFGDVPLLLNTDYAENAIKPRNAVDQVYGQIVQDLNEAKDLLDVTYPTAQRGRPNKWTAAALLSRVYLYNGNWANAEQEATSVINSGLYSLVTNLNNVFLLGSNETIWQLFSSLTVQNNTAEAALFIPATATARPSYPLTVSLLNSFEPSDLRKTNWTKSVIVSSQLYHYPFKYKVRGSTTTPVTEGLTMFRLAEQYLIRAEASAHQNNLSGALTDLNIIRTRAGLANVNGSTLDELLPLIAKERQMELFSEMGHRWFDLKRTGKAGIVLGSKPGWNEEDILFPIPELEREKNPFLIQNPGY